MSFRKIKARFKRSIQRTIGSYTMDPQYREVVLQNAIAERQANHPNPLTRFGKYGYSQCDEDGITFEVVRRLNIESGLFCEFGVGNGLENNTLSLLACGWQGFWVGGEKLAFDPADSSRLSFQKAWIDNDNIVSLYRNGLKARHADNVDLLSLDLDGNDYYLIDSLLGDGCRPQVVIIEYNAKLPPPMKFVIDYDPDHKWTGTDCFGASLASFAELFEKYDYQCICCNAGSGANAFFVQKEKAHLFPEVPDHLSNIYASPFYFIPTKVGHPQDMRTVQSIIR